MSRVVHRKIRPTAREKILASAGGACVLAGPNCTGLATTIDHWLPRCLGGDNKQENLRPACENCNRDKADMLPDEWWSFVANGGQKTTLKATINYDGLKNLRLQEAPSMTEALAGMGRKANLSDLNLYHKNPRIGNLDVIKSSLRAHGQYKPILVNVGTYTGRPYEVLAGNHCVDIETEALTKRGWVSGPDLTEDDTILSCDKDGQLRWSRIKSIFRNWDYSGLMYRLENQAIDAFVSPGHKFLLSDGRLRPVEDLKTSDVIITMGEALEGSEATYSDAFVELVGWAVTEGSFRIGTERTHPYEKPATKWVRISQLPGDYADRIEDCLEAVGAEYRVGRSGRQGRVLSFDVAKDIANELHDIAPNRVMTREFMHALTSDQRRLLIETMVDGDGWRHGNTLHYCQKDPEHMAALAYLAALSGLTTYERLRTPPETDGDYRNAQPCLVMTIHGDGQMSRKRAHFKKHWRTEDQYTGLIWCPETEYGTFVCRRGGKVYVTGNTLKAIRDLAEENPNDERWYSVDVWEVDFDDDKAARVVVADNRTSELGRTDDEVLLELLQELEDLEGTGYEDDDLDDLIALMEEKEEDSGSSSDGPDLGEGLMPSNSDNDKADTYAERGTRMFILSFPYAQYSWVAEKLEQYADDHDDCGDTNAEIVLHWLAEYSGEEPPQLSAAEAEEDDEEGLDDDDDIQADYDEEDEL